MVRILFYVIFMAFAMVIANHSEGQHFPPDSLINKLQRSEADTVKIKITKEILKYYVKAKDYDKAEKYAFEYKNLATKIGTNELLGKAFYNLGIVKWLKKQQAESNQYFEKSIPHIIATPDSVLLAKCYTKMATNYLRVSDFANAIQYYDLSSKIRMGIQDSTGLANNFINIAGCYYQMAEYTNAIRLYHAALNITEKTGNLRLIAYNFNNIGNIYMKIEDYPRAIEYLSKALHANRSLSNEREASKNLLIIGNAYQKIGDTIQAEKYYLESAQIKEKINDFEGLSATYNSLGSIYENLGRLDEALSFFLKANDLIQISNDRFAQASVLANIGSIYLINRQKEASSYFLKSLDIAKEINARQLTLSAYNNLIEYYRQNNEYEMALSYYELKTALNDSIYNENTTHAIAEMRTKYESEKKEKENEVLIKDIKIERDSKRFLIVIIIGLFLILTTSFYLFRVTSKSLKQSKILHQREKELNSLELAKKEVEKEHLEDKIFAEQQLNKMQKQKFEAELEHKNNELANSALCIVNKNEVLSNIKEKIVSGSKAVENEQLVPELIRFINNNIDIDQNWKKFKIQFEEVHPGFFIRLQQKHPDLSEIYIKLSAYIRINLTTSESAQLLNVTVAAVKKSRQRLRKKFDLDPEASLFQFISNI